MHGDRSDGDRISLTIYSLRKRLGLTQVELGRKISVRQNTVYRYEAGLLSPSPYVLLQLWRLAATEEELRTFSPGLALLVDSQVGGRRAAQERAS